MTLATYKKTVEETRRWFQEVRDAVCDELGVRRRDIPMLYERFWGRDVEQDIEWQGHHLAFKPFIRWQGDRGFAWEPGIDYRGGAGHKDSITLVYRPDEYAHPDCPECDCGIDDTRVVYTTDEARAWAKSVKEKFYKPTERESP